MLPGWLGLHTATLDVSLWEIARIVAIFLGVPLAAGYLTRRIGVARRGDRLVRAPVPSPHRPRSRCGACCSPSWCCSHCKARRSPHKPFDVARIALPLLAYFALMWGASFVLGYRLAARLPAYGHARVHRRRQQLRTRDRGRDRRLRRHLRASARRRRRPADRSPRTRRARLRRAMGATPLLPDGGRGRHDHPRRHPRRGPGPLPRRRARGQPTRDGGCCGPAAATTSRHGSAPRSTTTRHALPDAAVQASLGCGNPTAVAELRAGDVVLDLGSGGGIDVLLSARRVGPTGKAYGLDMTDEMLDLARTNAEQGRAPRTSSSSKGKIEAVPLPDASVDVIICNCVVNLSPDKPAVFAEMYRVLAARRPDRHQRRRRRRRPRRRRTRRARELGRLYRRRAQPHRVRDRPHRRRIRRRAHHLHARRRRRPARRDRPGPQAGGATMNCLDCATIRHRPGRGRHCASTAAPPSAPSTPSSAPGTSPAPQSINRQVPVEPAARVFRCRICDAARVAQHDGQLGTIQEPVAASSTGPARAA